MRRPAEHGGTHRGGSPPLALRGARIYTACVVEKKWKLPQLDDGFQEGPSVRVSQGDVASPLLSKLLRRRGILDEESAARFLHPKLGHLHDPFELPGMEEAVRLIE